MTAAAAHTSPVTHRPVMAAAVVEALAPRDGGVYVDATFGRGGYSRAILDAADCTVWALDRDPEAIAAGAALADHYAGRLHLIEGRFGTLDTQLDARGALPVDGIAFDLGVSSPQLDEAGRGFSFSHDGPLDMRMDGGGATAADIVNELSESELARIIREYGEDRKARRIAKAIVRAREAGRITRTRELAGIIRAAAGPKKSHDIDPATRSFQALRIHVNDELDELDSGLRAAERALATSGRLVVVAFHSLEDRRVKQFLRQRSGDRPRASRHSPVAETQAYPPATFRLVTRSARKPDSREAAANPRARSARLRAAERTAAPVWPADTGGEQDMQGGRP